MKCKSTVLSETPGLLLFLVLGNSPHLKSFRDTGGFPQVIQLFGYQLILQVFSLSVCSAQSLQLSNQATVHTSGKVSTFDTYESVLVEQTSRTVTSSETSDQFGGKAGAWLFGQSLDEQNRNVS